MSHPSGDSSSLGESWATWNPEDAELSEPDEDALSGSDFPSSGPSTGAKLSSQASASLISHLHPMHSSDECVSGPELIMPSIHEDYNADGSWVIHSPSARGKGSNPSSSARQESKSSSPGSTALYLPMMRDMHGGPTQEPPRRSSNSSVVFLKYVLAGLCLAFISYLTHAWLVPWPLDTANEHGETKDADGGLAIYHHMLKKYTVMEHLSMNGRASITESNAHLKRSEDAVTRLCEILVEGSTGPKHELEFECQSAVRAVNEGIKQSDTLVNHIDVVANREVAACIQRSEKLLAYSTSLHDSGGLFYRLLNKYFAGFSVAWASKSTSDLLAEQFEQCSDTIRHVTHTQIDLTRAILQTLDHFQANLQSVDRMISLVPPNDNCSVKLRPVDTTNPFVIFTRKLKQALERVLIDPFIGPPQCVYGLSSELKLCVFGKIRDGLELQNQARRILDGFLNDLRSILWDLDVPSPSSSRT